MRTRAHRGAAAGRRSRDVAVAGLQVVDGLAWGHNPSFDRGVCGGVAPLAGGGLGGHFWRRNDGKEARPAAQDVVAAALLLRFDAALSVDMFGFFFAVSRWVVTCYKVQL